jgi:uncharacterized membrane protein YwaF
MSITFTETLYSTFPRLSPTAVLIAHIAAIVMTIIMIMHIRSKYTAVGRKEMVFFFYLYALLELLGIFVDTAIIPFSSPVYPVSGLLLFSLQTRSNPHQH